MPSVPWNVQNTDPIQDIPPMPQTHVPDTLAREEGKRAFLGQEGLPA